TAASLSFQSSIASHDARDRADVLKAGDAQAEVGRVLDADRAAVAAARSQIEGRSIQDTASFETVGAAQVRLLEAESRLASGEALVKNASVMDGVYEATYAAERAATAQWWLKLG